MVLQLLQVVLIAQNYYTAPTTDSVPTAECWGLGQPSWMPAALESSIMVEESYAFFKAYHEQRELFGKGNRGGNGLFHSLAIWVTLRRLRPLVVVESGVLHGQTSWLIRRATAEWTPYLIRFDPGNGKNFQIWRDSLSNGTIDFLDQSFVDISSLQWKNALPSKVRAIPMSKWLIFFDDHTDHLSRLKVARDIGARHVLFDDNYIAGFGDSFSVKAACNGGNQSGDLSGDGGVTRRFFAKHPNRKFKRCSAFHRQCHSLQEKEASDARTELLQLADVYWETPPLAPLVPLNLDTLNPGSFVPFLQYSRVGGWAEGVKGPFTREQVDVLLRNCKPPLYASVAKVHRTSGITEQEIEHEAGNFCNMAYVHLRFNRNANKGPSGGWAIR